MSVKIWTMTRQFENCLDILTGYSIRVTASPVLKKSALLKVWSSPVWRVFQWLKRRKFPDVICTEREKTDYYYPLIGRDSEDSGSQ